MTRSLFCGCTNYADQTFEDIIIDLKQIVEDLKFTIEIYKNNIKVLDNANYWVNVDYDFKIVIAKGQRLFNTSLHEITEILTEINKEVKEHHVKRLSNLSELSEELEREFSTKWHGWKSKDYGNEHFILVERLCREGQQMTLDMLDVSNMAARLNDFIGRTNEKILEVKPEFYGVKINIIEILKRLFKMKKTS